MNSPYITDKEISARYGVTRQTVYRWARTGHFPKPVRLSPQCTRWKQSDVEAWEAAKAAEKEDVA